MLMRFGLNLAPQRRVFGAFFIYSLALGGIFPRLGDIQLAMGIAEGALGLALLGPGIGTFISLTFASPVLDRFGYRRTLFIGIPGLALAMAAASFASSPAMLFALLFIAGLTIGAIEVVINVEADRTEHALGRRVMNRCHAFWSFGFFAAGIVGAAAKQLGLSPQLHLGLMVPVVMLAVVPVLGRFEAALARPGGDAPAAAPRFASPSAAILVLVVFALSSLMLEGAGSDWSVIYMRDVFGTLPFVNAMAFAAGALFQALVRFFADGFVERFGALTVGRASTVAMMTGGLAVVLAPHPVLALAGFALIGMGTAAVFPLAMSAAAQRTDRAAAINVAAVAQLSFVAFLIGPPLLGFVAEHYGVRMSYAVCLPLVVASWFAARSLRPPQAGLKPSHA